MVAGHRIDPFTDGLVLVVQSNIAHPHADTPVGLRHEADRLDLCIDARADFQTVGRLVMDQQGAVAGHALGEDLERLDDLINRRVQVQVVGLDVEDRRVGREEVVEAAVILTGLRDENLVRPGLTADTNAAADLFAVSPDDERRVELGLDQDVAEDGGGGGLAMRARDRDADAPDHEPAQQLCVFDDLRHAGLPRRLPGVSA